MTESIPYLVLGVVLLFFLVPSAIGLRIERRRDQVSPDLRIDMAFLGGVAGIRIGMEAGEWSLYPLLGPWRLRLLRLRLGMGRWPAKRKSPTPNGQRPSRQGRASRGVSKPPGRRLYDRARLYFPLGMDLLKRLRRTLVLRKLQMKGALGFEDPAKTGCAAACLQGLTIISSKRIEIDFSPDFERPGLRGRLYLDFRLHLGYLLVLALILAIKAALGRLVARAPGFLAAPGSSRI